MMNQLSESLAREQVLHLRREADRLRVVRALQARRRAEVAVRRAQRLLTSAADQREVGAPALWMR